MVLPAAVVVVKAEPLAGAAVMMTGVTPRLSVVTVPWVKMEPGLSDAGAWYGGGGGWSKASRGAGAEVGSAPRSGAVSGVGTGVVGAGGWAGVAAAASSTGAEMEATGTWEGAGESATGGGVGVCVGTAGLGTWTSTVVAAALSTGGLSAGGSGLSSGSRGETGSTRGPVALGSSGDSREEVRRLLKEEKAVLALGSGGLNTPPELMETTGLERSVAPVPKLNCAAPIPRPPPPLSGCANTKPDVAGLAGASLVSSSPWPTRSPEKLPRVSPPRAGWGSTRRAPVLDEGLTGSPDTVGGGVGEPAPRAGEAEADLGVKEKGSSVAEELNSIFPTLPPPDAAALLNENLAPSFTCDPAAPWETDEKLKALLDAALKEKPLLLCSPRDGPEVEEPSAALGATPAADPKTKPV